MPTYRYTPRQKQVRSGMGDAYKPEYRPYEDQGEYTYKPENGRGQPQYKPEASRSPWSGDNRQIGADMGGGDLGPEAPVPQQQFSGLSPNMAPSTASYSPYTASSPYSAPSGQTTTQTAPGQFTVSGAASGGRGSLTSDQYNQMVAAGSGGAAAGGSGAITDPGSASYQLGKTRINDAYGRGIANADYMDAFEQARHLRDQQQMAFNYNRMRDGIGLDAAARGLDARGSGWAQRNQQAYGQNRLSAFAQALAQHQQQMNDLQLSRQDVVRNRDYGLQDLAISEAERKANLAASLRGL